MLNLQKLFFFFFFLSNSDAKIRRHVDIMNTFSYKWWRMVREHNCMSVRAQIMDLNICVRVCVYIYIHV